jgi:DNA-binding response OmpR family regulator
VLIRHHLDMERAMSDVCVLVVEDEVAIRDVLETLLRRDGFDPHTCATGAQALPALDALSPAVVLLDLGLPDVNGFDLLRTIRSRSEATVIVLSGRASESDRVLALELGADDYVVKPFLTRELVARIRAHRRRAAAPIDRLSGPLAVGDLQIDLRSREVTVAGEPVSLTAREFDLLHFLASSPRQVFSRDQILEHAWGLRSCGSRTPPSPSTSTASARRWEPSASSRCAASGTGSSRWSTPTLRNRSTPRNC